MFNNCQIQQVVCEQTGCTTRFCECAKAKEKCAADRQCADNTAIAPSENIASSPQIYNHLRVLFPVAADYEEAIVMLKRCSTTHDLAVVVVNNLQPQSKHPLEDFTRQGILGEFIDISKLKRGGTLGNLRTQIKNYNSHKDQAYRKDRPAE